MNNTLKKAITPATTPAAQETTTKPTFIPIKDKIKTMDQNNRLEAEKNEFEKIFSEVTSKDRKSPRIESLGGINKSPLVEKPQEQDEDEKTDDEKSVEKTSENGGGLAPESMDDEKDDGAGDDSCSSYEEDNTGGQFQNGSNGAPPPKPLPRTSRTNSIADTNSNVEEIVSPTTRPQPKPRTTAYKVNRDHDHL